MIDGVHLVQNLKRKVLSKYVHTLERLDPAFSQHILNAQKEFFLAGRSFFDAEAGHAQKAIDRIQRKAGTKE